MTLSLKKLNCGARATKDQKYPLPGASFPGQNRKGGEAPKKGGSGVFVLNSALVNQDKEQPQLEEGSREEKEQLQN